ncbi:hypothetical protein D9758_008239 [Tetrapyrgos nigripes]|uniref:F-box domain-containing protein n=1 Tax=Tetrapyrgos nigripes TaxID=182062 RepID=A0A8H5G1E2_9AGAR|nr:hypothetical protein D9758_008239 [Tetrapyrgos nigripes]
MVSGMHSCPVELASYIFSLACTDDGATVHSLSLVSRSFNDICAFLRYDSVSIHNREQIARVSASLSKLPPHLRRIHHLYIFLAPPQARVDVNDDIELVFRILQFASPTLESLAFVYPNTVMSSTAISRLFRTPFPNLHELTVHGFYPFPNSSTMHMPRLERLHLSGNRNPYGLFHMNCLNDSLPYLTHLRVSGLLMASSFAIELECVVNVSRGVDSEQISPVPGRLPLPSKLEHIVIQPGYNPATRTSMGNMKKDEAMMKTLQDVVRCQDTGISDGVKGNLRVVLENRGEVPDMMMKEVLYRDWMSRLDGKAGCWPLECRV